MQFKESDFERIFAVGDIHGSSKSLRELLIRISPTKRDLLVFLGDYINRGPDSKGVIDILLELGNTTNAKFIMGNHDEMLLGALSGGKDNIKFFSKFGQDTIDSYKLNFEVRNFPREHALFFADLDEFVESENFMFVHASIDPFRELMQQMSTHLRWTTISSVLKDKCKSDKFPHFSGKTLICGHDADTMVRRYDKHKIICIDTGCMVKEAGSLTAFNVLDGSIISV